MDQYKLARECYLAYSRGEPMPEFNVLPYEIKEAWKIASDYVFLRGYEEGFEKGKEDESN